MSARMRAGLRLLGDEEITPQGRRLLEQILDAEEAEAAHRDAVQEGEGWWGRHPAYGALCRAFGRHTASPAHLAFLALTGLHSEGWEILRAEHDER